MNSRVPVDIPVETIRMRIQGVKEAAERARKVFIVASVASLSIIAVCWNAYFSWYKSFGEDQQIPSRGRVEMVQKLELIDECSIRILAAKERQESSEEIAGDGSQSDRPEPSLGTVEACCNFLIGPAAGCAGDCDAERIRHLNACGSRAAAWSREFERQDAAGSSLEALLASRNFQFLELPLHEAFPGFPRGSTAGRQQLAEAWRESRWLSLDLLGLRVGVSDLAVLGCSGILIIVVWFFFSVRREDHALGELLQDAKRLPKDVKWMVFHGVTAHLIFVYNRNDLPHRMDQSSKEEKAGILRLLLFTLYFLPAIAAFCIVFVDLWSLLWASSPFRASSGPLLLSGDLTTEELWKLARMMFVSTCAFALTSTSCIRIMLMERNINRNVEAFYAKVLGGKRSAAGSSKSAWKRIKRFAAR